MLACPYRRSPAVLVLVALVGAGWSAPVDPARTRAVREEYAAQLRQAPVLREINKQIYFDRVLVDEPQGQCVLRFHLPDHRGHGYAAWTRGDATQPLAGLDGLFWNGPVEHRPLPAAEIRPGRKLAYLLPCAPQSPVIASIAVEGEPLEPFPSEGDLWMNTWADDDALYSGWGDGKGVNLDHAWTDCGIARFTGDLPNLSAEEMLHSAPTPEPPVNDKPSSLLYIDGRLYGHFHSPLGDAWLGFLAWSDDKGKTWTRDGFYREWEMAPPDGSPWCRDRNSKFRCAFFINMGKNYDLNRDGYVYALGIGTEWNWLGGAYLARVPRKRLLDYSAWRYFAGMQGEKPRWSESQFDAVALPGVLTEDQASAMYHPQLKRYLLLTRYHLYDAPQPWGPWSYAGTWTDEHAPILWQGGYQPGIVSKGTGPDWFWFTIAGQNQKPKITYNFHLCKLRMQLRGD